MDSLRSMRWGSEMHPTKASLGTVLMSFFTLVFVLWSCVVLFLAVVVWIGQWCSGCRATTALAGMRAAVHHILRGNFHAGRHRHSYSFRYIHSKNLWFFSPHPPPFVSDLHRPSHPITLGMAKKNCELLV